jgi:hypothetical protein
MEDKYEAVTETISKGRLRIFYRGANRNSTYISDEVANELISSLPYTPVKGIYNEDDEDFEDHGTSSQDGQIFGIVPDNPNFAWEKHTDEDGVEREYATTDVYIYTSLYPEAKEIFGKSQSMELYPPSITGDWEQVDGQSMFVFKSAKFLGLQVLGDNVEPCFEGAAFYEKMTLFFSKLGEIEMAKDKITFSLSFEDKREFLFTALNEGKDSWTKFLVSTYDTDIIYVDYEKEGFYKTSYAIDDGGKVTLGEPIQVFEMFLTAEEKEALDSKESQFTTLETERDELKAEFETYKASVESTDDEKATQLQEYTVKIADYEIKIAEYDARIAEFEASLKSVDDARKEEIFARYAKVLKEETIEQFKKQDIPSEQLEKDLAFALVKEKDVFSLQGDITIPTGNPGGGSELDNILEKYARRD